MVGLCCIQILVQLSNYAYTAALVKAILFSFQAIIHPDTGKKVFMPFRMSGESHQL